MISLHRGTWYRTHITVARARGCDVVGHAAAQMAHVVVQWHSSRVADSSNVIKQYRGRWRREESVDRVASQTETFAISGFLRVSAIFLRDFVPSQSRGIERGVRRLLATNCRTNFFGQRGQIVTAPFDGWKW